MPSALERGLRAGRVEFLAQVVLEVGKPLPRALDRLVRLSFDVPQSFFGAASCLRWVKVFEENFNGGEATGQVK